MRRLPLRPQASHARTHIITTAVVTTTIITMPEVRTVMAVMAAGTAAPMTAVVVAGIIDSDGSILRASFPGVFVGGSRLTNIDAISAA